MNLTDHVDQENAEIWNGQLLLMVTCKNAELENGERETEHNRHEERYVRLDVTDEGLRGVLDSDAEWVFTRGHCENLARTLNRLTDLPIIVAGFPSLDHGFVRKHAGVLVDEDTVLDIYGIQDREEWVDGCTHGVTWREAEGRVYDELPDTRSQERREELEAMAGEAGMNFDTFLAKTKIDPDAYVPEMTDEQLDAFAAALLEREEFQRAAA
jgi:hypothetical protein